MVLLEVMTMEEVIQRETVKVCAKKAGSALEGAETLWSHFINCT